MSFSLEYEGLSYCQGMDLNCEWSKIRKWKKSGIGAHQGSDGIPRKCLSACNKQVYEIKLTSQSYPFKELFIKRKDICYVLKKLEKICNDTARKRTFEAKYGNLMSCSQIKAASEQNICVSDKFQTEIDPFLASGLYEYASENVAHVKVYLRDPFASVSTREAQISLGSFVGNFGGLMGMFLGLSAFGVFEIIYFSAVQILQK